MAVGWLRGAAGRVTVLAFWDLVSLCGVGAAPSGRWLGLVQLCADAVMSKVAFLNYCILLTG